MDVFFDIIKFQPFGRITGSTRSQVGFPLKTSPPSWFETTKNHQKNLKQQMTTHHLQNWRHLEICVLESWISTAPRCSGKPFSIKAQLVDGFLISLVPKTSPPKKTKETRSYNFVHRTPTIYPSCGIDGFGRLDMDFQRFPVSKKSHNTFLWNVSSIPIGSMYGIFTYIYHKNQPNVGVYTIHGSYGISHR